MSQNWQGFILTFNFKIIIKENFIINGKIDLTGGQMK